MSEEDVSHKGRRETKTIGSYIMGTDLGQGAFGKVKLATHIQTGEKVAIKILDKDKIMEEDEDDIIRVQKEIAILKKLRHKNIVQLYELMETPRNIYLAMEYCEGKELFDYIIMKKKLSEAEACKFFQEIISGIEYLHSQNIVHRDLKPENLLLDHKLSIKISDFGLSTTYTNDRLLSTACGTPSYAPPEMLRGEEYHGQLSDLWSCGVILYAMLAGYLPFSESNEDLNCQKIMDGDFEMLDYISESCQDLMRNILQADPLDRYDIDQVKSHPWFNSFPLRHCPGLIIGYHKIPIDNNILEEIQKYGYDKETAREHILNCKFDVVTSTYYLSLRRWIKEGNASISDLNSDAYVKYITDESNLVNPSTMFNVSVIDEEREDNIEEAKEVKEDLVGLKSETRLVKFSLKIKRKSLFMHGNLLKEIELQMNKPRRGTYFESKRERKNSLDSDKETILKLNSPKKRHSVFTDLTPDLGMRLLNQLDNSIEQNENELGREELLNRTPSSINMSYNEIYLVDNSADVRAHDVNLMPQYKRADSYADNLIKAEITQFEKKTHPPIQTIEIPLRKSLQTCSSEKAIPVSPKKLITPKWIETPPIAVSTNRNRFLSIGKQVKPDRRAIETSIENTPTKSVNRNISYSPNSAIRPQNKRIAAVPWNLKKRALENSVNKTRLQEYEEFKKLKIEVKKRDKKMINIKKLKKEGKPKLNTSCIEKTSRNLYKNNSQVSYCNSMKSSTRLNKVSSVQSTLTQRRPVNKKIFNLDDQQHRQLKSFEGPIDLSCIYDYDIDYLLLRVVDVLHHKKVVYIKTNPYKFRCSKNGISFDIEVFKLDFIECYYIRLRYTQGDITRFRKYTQTLVNELHK
jgi:serine/threonine protein kinase